MDASLTRICLLVKKGTFDEMLQTTAFEPAWETSLFILLQHQHRSSPDLKPYTATLIKHLLDRLLIEIPISYGSRVQAYVLRELERYFWKHDIIRDFVRTVPAYL